MPRRAALAAALLACALALGAGAAQAADPDLAQAETLLRTGQAAKAYEYLLPFEDEHAGNPRYDYLLGVAALDSGKADRATLAFERVLAMDPNFAGARLDMARAYFHLGDYARSRAEFEAVLKQNPPPVARAAIERYLAAITEREQAKQTVITGFMELTRGHDNNVNNSTAAAQVGVPALGNLIFTLDPTNIKRADDYTAVAAGGEIAHELRPGFSIFGGGTARLRANDQADLFDTKSVEARGGAALAGESSILRLQLNQERFYLDHEASRTSRGLTADMKYLVGPASFLSVFAQRNEFRFEDPALVVNDFNQRLYGAGWAWLFHESRSVLSLTAFTGSEVDLRRRADGAKVMNGLRLGGQLNLGARFDLFASVGAQKGDYKRENAAFLATRVDRLTDLALGLIFKLDEHWSLRPMWLHIENRSNIPIYAYRRDDVSLTLRRDFK